MTHSLLQGIDRTTFPFIAIIIIRRKGTIVKKNQMVIREERVIRVMEGVLKMRSGMG